MLRFYELIIHVNVMLTRIVDTKKISIHHCSSSFIRHKHKGLGVLVYLTKILQYLDNNRISERHMSVEILELNCILIVRTLSSYSYSLYIENDNESHYQTKPT